MSSTAYPIWHTSCRIPFSSSSGSRGATLIVVLIALVVVIVVVVMVLVVVVAVIRPTLHIAYGRLHAANLELHIANGIPHAAYVINIAYPIAQTACRRPHIPYGTPHAAYHIPVALVAEVLLLIVVVVVVVVVVAVGTTRLRELDSPSTHALPRLIATDRATQCVLFPCIRRLTSKCRWEPSWGCTEEQNSGMARRALSSSNLHLLQPAVECALSSERWTACSGQYLIGWQAAVEARPMRAEQS